MVQVESSSRVSYSPGLKQKFMIALARNGWTPEDVDRASRSDMLKHIRDEYITGVKLFRQRPTELCVTEGDGQRYEYLLEAGRYWGINPDLITHIQSDQFQMGQVFQDVVIDLLEFSSAATAFEIRDYLRKNGYQGATTEDAMRIGATYSNEVLCADSGIMFTGMPWVNKWGMVNVTVLLANDRHNRMLTSCHLDELGVLPGKVVAARKRIIKRRKF